MGRKDLYRIKMDLISSADPKNNIEIDMYIDDSDTIGTVEGVSDVSLFLDQVAMLNELSLDGISLSYGDAPIGRRNQVICSANAKYNVYDQCVLYLSDPLVKNVSAKNSIIIGKGGWFSGDHETVHFDRCVLENCVIVANRIETLCNCFFHNCVIYTDEIFFPRMNCHVVVDGETIALEKKEKSLIVEDTQKMSKIEIDGIPPAVFKTLYDNTVVHPYREFSKDSIPDIPINWAVLTDIVRTKEKEKKYAMQFKNKNIFISYDGYFSPSVRAEKCTVTGYLEFSGADRLSFFHNCNLYDCLITNSKYSKRITFNECKFHSTVCTLKGSIVVRDGEFYNSMLVAKSGVFRKMKYPTIRLHKSLLDAKYSDVITDRKKPFLHTKNSNIYFNLREKEHLDRIKKYIQRHPSFCRKGVLNVSVDGSTYSDTGPYYDYIYIYV